MSSADPLADPSAAPAVLPRQPEVATPVAGVPLSIKFGWAMGSVGTVTMLYLVNVFLLYYLTSYLGIGAATAGLLLFLTRLYDIVVDPFIGSWSDRTESRWGRRHPWMLGGAVIAALGCALLFNLHRLPLDAAPTVLATLAMLVFFTGYTTFYIPHMCLASEMTRSYDERTSVMVYRTFLITIAGIGVTTGIPALVALWGGREQSYGRIGLVAAAVVFVSMLVAVLGTPGGALRQEARPGRLRWADFRGVLANRPFVCLLGAKVIGLLGTAFSGPVLMLFFTQVLERGPASLSLFGLATGLGGIAGLPLWSALARRAGKRRACIVAYVLHALLALSWWLGTPTEVDAAFVARCFLMGLAGQGSLTLGLAMLLDVLAHEARVAGRAREGLFVGVFALAEKGAYACGPLLAGLLLGAMGFVSGTQGPLQQPPEAILAARLAMSIIPATFGSIAIVALLLYRLPEEQEKGTDLFSAPGEK